MPLSPFNMTGRMMARSLQDRSSLAPAPRATARCRAAAYQCRLHFAAARVGGARPREAADFLDHVRGESRKVARAYHPQRAGEVDAVDHKRWIVAIRFALAVDRDEQPVVVDRRLGAEAADDPDQFHCKSYSTSPVVRGAGISGGGAVAPGFAAPKRPPCTPRRLRARARSLSGRSPVRPSLRTPADARSASSPRAGGCRSCGRECGSRRRRAGCRTPFSPPRPKDRRSSGSRCRPAPRPPWDRALSPEGSPAAAWERVGPPAASWVRRGAPPAFWLRLSS